MTGTRRAKNGTRCGLFDGEWTSHRLQTMERKNHEAALQVREEVLPGRRERQVPGGGAISDLRQLVPQRRRPCPRSVQLSGDDRKARLQVRAAQKRHLVSRHIRASALSRRVNKKSRKNRLLSP